MKMMSLFDGSGGFPLAASMCGIEPRYASEVEPYPIAVTRSRFPNMEHLRDVSKVHGWDLEPVDVITFGSPCQDMSIAGKRAGIKHEENGDEETTRSGLFMEAVRIIKEMRKATNGRYPAFAVWENVPGAFSSNKGEDFRLVLKELVQIVEPEADVPGVPKGGWSYYDCWRGDGWSLAYRTFDAQYWGVPQRRRRIYLVLDLRGRRAGEVLFKRPGLRGYFEESGTAGEGTAYDAERGIGADDREVYNESGRGYWMSGFGCLRAEGENRPSRPSMCIVQASGFKAGQSMAGGIGYQAECAATLSAQASGTEPTVCIKAYSVENHPADSRVNIDESGKCQTLTSRMGTGGGNVPLLLAPASTYCLQYIVRRLTPTECARLQGFPDKWGHPDYKGDLTDEEYQFWQEVRNTHAAVNGRAVKEHTKAQILTWYNKLHTDSAEYKMWGNGIALPNALYVMQGIADALNT